MLNGKHILIGVSGGIAAYKTCEVVRQFKKMNADVKIVMTESATHFVGSLTFEALSKNTVETGIFSPGKDNTALHHIEIAEWADIGLICPATLNTMSKIAYGMADNLLTTIVSAMRKSVIFAPAMDLEMWQNPITQDTISRLKTFGYPMIEPESGELASGLVGPGRLADPEVIVGFVKNALLSSEPISGEKPKQNFAGKHILITAGGTQESIDPVRYITNRSTGKMGYALAAQAVKRGAKVTLISAPTHLPAPDGVALVSVKTAEEMLQAADSTYEKTDVAILASAVSDYRPKHFADDKMKRTKENLVLELTPTKDIAAHLGKKKGNRIVVGFALETSNELENAKKKLVKKNFDFIVLNNPKVDGAGFETDTNVVTIIDDKTNTKEYPKLPKSEVADIVLDAILKRLSP